MRFGVFRYLFGVCLAVFLLGAIAVPISGCRCDGDKKGSAKSQKKKKGKKDGSLSVLDDGVFIRQKGRWQKESAELNELEKKQLEKLGYLTGYEKKSGQGGVTVHEDSAYDGFNLYTSGHTTAATLMDMKGKILHTWDFDPSSEFFLPNLFKKRKMGMKYMRRAHLFPNGDLLALYDFVGMAKLNRNSKKYWFKDALFHHDFFVTKKGDIYTIEDEEIDGSLLGFEYDIIDNLIVIMNGEGEVKKKVSLARCFKNSLSEKVIRGLFSEKVLSRIHKGDVFHTNSIQLLEKGAEFHHAAFKKGNALISIRSINAIAVINLEKEIVELHFTGDWIHQHEASLQPTGNILFFDNKGKKTYSRIIEINPKTLKKEWIYVASPKNSFYSRLQGTVDRLPGGHTLITESTWGRAFELDGRKKKVWEYISPYRSAQDRELVAVLFDLNRIEPDFPMDWIRGAKERN